MGQKNPTPQGPGEMPPQKAPFEEAFKEACHKAIFFWPKREKWEGGGRVWRWGRGGGGVRKKWFLTTQQGASRGAGKAPPQSVFFCSGGGGEGKISLKGGAGLGENFPRGLIKAGKPPPPPPAQNRGGAVFLKTPPHFYFGGAFFIFPFRLLEALGKLKYYSTK